MSIVSRSSWGARRWFRRERAGPARRVVLSALALVVLVSMEVRSVAQGDTYGVLTYAGTLTAPVLYAIDATGSVKTTLGTLPGGFFPWSAAMSDDNRTIRVVGYTITPAAQGAIFDVTSSGLTTVHAGSPLTRPTRILPTSDGDWLVFDSFGTSGGHVFRLTGSTLTTVTPLAGFVYGVAHDADSGQVIIRGLVGTPARGGLYRLDQKTGAITSFWAPSAATYLANYGAHELVVDATSGAVIDLHYTTTTRNAQLSRYHPELGRLPIGSSTLNALPVGLARADQTGGAYVTALARATTAQAVEIVKLGRDGSIVKRASITGITPYALSPFFRIGGRHLAWRMRNAPNDRLLRIDVPGAGNKTYGVAMSLTGVRPGVLIGGGREISLVPDSLTILCLQGGIPGVLGPTIGTLDAAGRAGVVIDANPLGSAVKGTVAWVAAVVLDPAAPAGISHVLGPERVLFR